MSKLITGGCLCGAVKFETKNSFNRFFLCHCEQCRRITGSAFAANLFGDIAQFRWLKGENSVVVFTLPNRDVTKAFCSICGAGVPFEKSDKSAMLVPAGCLNSDPVFKSRSRIFCKEIKAWASSLEEAHSYTEFPTE